MSKKLITAIVLITALLIMTNPAMAINFGEPDDGEHPYVGAMFIPLGGGGFAVCSGTLIADDVFLTAGHCAFLAQQVGYCFVSFGEYPLSTPLIPGFAYAHPDFDPDVTPPDTYDIGVVLLLALPFPPITPATIAPVGFLETYKKQVGQQDTLFDSVGYGLQSIMPPEDWDFARYKGEQRIINLVNHHNGGYNVQLTNNPGLGNGSGGTCSGDSGGPILRDDMIVAINSFGIAPYCKGNDFAYRVDIQDSHDFLCPYIPSLCP